MPIVLHLIRRQNADSISFPSLMFLHKLPSKEVERRRLKYWFLLLLRCLGILLLVVAFARPVITQGGINQNHPLSARSVVILIDCSLSMSRQATWEKALGAADGELQSLGTGDEALVMQFAKTAQVLSDWREEIGTLWQILKKRVKPGLQSTSYEEGLRRAVEQFEGPRRGRKEIFLITDLQRTGLENRSRWKVPGDVKVRLEDVGSEAFNLFIEEVDLERDVYGEQYPYPIQVRLRSVPPQAVRGKAQLVVEGRRVDRKRFEMTETRSVAVTFPPFELEEGVSRGKVVIEPPDSLASDNTFFFVVERQRPRKIMVCSSPGKTSAFYLKRVFSTGQNRRFQVESVEALGPRIDTEETPVVILDDLAAPPRPSVIDSYVKGGGGLIVALSSSVRADVYNLRWEGFLPVELSHRYFAKRDKKPFLSITEVSWEHPVFAVFRNLQQSAISKAQFFSYWKVKPKRDGVVVARFSRGDPALVEKRLEKGRILIFTSSLDTVWTDFPLRTAYVPFWYRMVEYAAGWQASQVAMRVGQVLPVEAEAQTAGHHSWPKGNIIDPRGHRILRLDGETPGFVTLGLPGHYEIRSNKKTDWVAANCDPAESDFRPVSPKEFAAAFALGSGQSRQASSLLEPGSGLPTQQTLWWPLLVCAALVLGLEPVVANRFYGRLRDNRLQRTTIDY